MGKARRHKNSYMLLLALGLTAILTTVGRKAEPQALDLTPGPSVAYSLEFHSLDRARLLFDLNNPLRDGCRSGGLRLKPVMEDENVRGLRVRNIDSDRDHPLYRMGLKNEDVALNVNGIPIGPESLSKIFRSLRESHIINILVERDHRNVMLCIDFSDPVTEQILMQRPLVNYLDSKLILR